MQAKASAHASFFKKFSEETLAMQQQLKHASAVLRGPLNTSIATTPYDVVYTEDRVKLKHYPCKKKRPGTRPLLVIYALINRETMLDLEPERSVIRTFIDKGRDLYCIDWGYPTRKDRFLTIDDHVNGYIDNMVDFIRSQTGYQRINIMGICMGGTFSVIYTALHPEKVEHLITTATPTNFDTDKGLLHTWMRCTPVEQLVDTMGNMPGDLLNIGFLLLNPARLVMGKYMDFVKNADNKAFVENFVRMEKWIFDSPDVPGETFRQFIQDCYHNNLLIQNKMIVGEKLVDLKKITMPVLNIYGKYDHLVPPEACNKLTRAVGSEDTRDICLNTGHIGLYVSSKYQKEFGPAIVEWLSRRESAKTKARAHGKPSRAIRSSSSQDIPGGAYPLEPSRNPP